MGGGLMQLVAYGAQDVYLTGNPQITFFKVVYRRHTNFSMECIEQTFNGTTDFSKKASCTISRNGDLIHSMHLQCTLPAVNASEGWCEDIGKLPLDPGIAGYTGLYDLDAYKWNLIENSIFSSD